MQIFFAGGGTGGHLYPAVAVAEEVKKQDPEAKIIFVASKNGLEIDLINKLGFSFIEIWAGKFRRYYKSLIINLINPFTLFANIFDLFKSAIGFWQSLFILGKFRPDVIFVKGGYVGLPLGFAAYFRRIPVVIHESDIVPGLANKILGKISKKILVSFPKDNFANYFNLKKVIETGNPIRSDILKGDKERGLKKFKLKKDLPIILVIGGSQGSRQINEAVLESLSELLQSFQIVHLSGALDYERLKIKTRELKNLENYRLFEFLSSDLADAYALADLIITRAGANVLFEIAALEKPAIVIPLAWSTGDHQYQNAVFFSRQNAVYLLPPEKLTSHSLIGAISSLMDSPEEIQTLSYNIKKLSNLNSSSIIAEEIIKLAKK